MARLENGADLHSERLAARIALVGADTGALALQGAALIDHTTVRANAPVGPHMGFYEGVGGFLVVKVLLAQD